MISSESYIFLAVFAVLALEALIYLLSPMSLRDQISVRGAQIRGRVRWLFLRKKYPHNTRTFLLRAYVDIALEHHEAIWLLTESRLNGSAFAMVRLVYDTMLRAFWEAAVALDMPEDFFAPYFADEGHANLRFLHYPPQADMSENTFGTAPLNIGAASIATHGTESNIVASSLHKLTVNGSTTFRIPAGAVMLSDAVDMQVPARTDLAIDIFVPDNLGSGSSPIRVIGPWWPYWRSRAAQVPPAWPAPRITTCACGSLISPRCPRMTPPST